MYKLFGEKGEMVVVKTIADRKEYLDSGYYSEKDLSRAEVAEFKEVNQTEENGSTSKADKAEKKGRGAPAKGGKSDENKSDADK